MVVGNDTHVTQGGDVSDVTALQLYMSVHKMAARSKSKSPVHRIAPRNSFREVRKEIIHEQHYGQKKKPVLRSVEEVAHRNWWATLKEERRNQRQAEMNSGPSSAWERTGPAQRHNKGVQCGVDDGKKDSTFGRVPSLSKKVSDDGGVRVYKQQFIFTADAAQFAKFEKQDAIKYEAVMKEIDVLRAFKRRVEKRLFPEEEEPKSKKRSRDRKRSKKDHR